MCDAVAELSEPYSPCYAILAQKAFYLLSKLKAQEVIFCIAELAQEAFASFLYCKLKNLVKKSS